MKKLANTDFCKFRAALAQWVKSQTTCLVAAAVLLCCLLSLTLLYPQKTSAQGDKSRLMATMPRWLRWAASPEGLRVLHHSSHPGAPGLLRALGEDPTITILPARHPALLQAPGNRSLEPDAATGCPAAGQSFTLEPVSGDINAPFFGVVQPYPKLVTGLATNYGAGINGSDITTGTAFDYRAFYGGLGNSPAVVDVHLKNPAIGEVTCAPQIEFAIPGATADGTDLLALSGASVAQVGPAADAFVTMMSGSSSTGAVNGVGVAYTNLATETSNACLTDPEGAAKNSACTYGVYVVVNGPFNVTAGTGVVYGNPTVTVDSTNADIFPFWSADSLATNTFSVNIAVCPVPGTGESFSCGATGLVTLDTANIVSISATGVPGSPGTAAVVILDAGGNIYTDTCTASTFPNAPTCGSVTLVVTVGNPLNNTEIVGQNFSVDSSVGIAVGADGTTAIVYGACGDTIFITPFRNTCFQPQVTVQNIDGFVLYKALGFYPTLTSDPFTGDFVLTDFVSQKNPEALGLTSTVIPSGGGTPTSTQIGAAIYPSNDGSSAGTVWSPAYGTSSNSNVYIHGPTTNAKGNWGSNTGEFRELNGIWCSSLSPTLCQAVGSTE